MPAPKPAEQDEVAVDEPALLDRIHQGERDRCRTGVAGAVDHRRHPLGRQPQPGRGGIHDPHVGLVGHEQGDVVDGHLGPLQREPGGIDGDPDGLAEHLLASHHHAGAVIGVQQRHQGTVDAEVPAEQRAFAGHGLDHDGPGAVAEKEGVAAVRPVGGPGQGLGADRAAPGPCRRPTRPAAVTRPYVKPAQAALRSMAPPPMPRAAEAAALLAGMSWSGVVVHSINRSDVRASEPGPVEGLAVRPRRPGWRWFPGRFRDGGAVARPRRARWRRAGCECRCARRSIRRSSRTELCRSALVTIRSGRAVPQPVMAAPVMTRATRRSAGRSAPAHPGWARAPSRRPANGDRTSLPPTVPSRVPDLDAGPDVELEFRRRVGRSRRPG